MRFNVLFLCYLLLPHTLPDSTDIKMNRLTHNGLTLTVTSFNLGGSRTGKYSEYYCKKGVLFVSRCNFRTIKY